MKRPYKKTNLPIVLGFLMSISLLICSTPLHAQKSKAVLTFKDGTVKKGFGALVSRDQCAKAFFDRPILEGQHGF